MSHRRTQKQNEKYLKMKQKSNHIITKLTCSKALLRGNFIVISAYIKKKKGSQKSNLTLNLKKLNKHEKTSPKLGEGRTEQQSEQKCMK